MEFHKYIPLWTAMKKEAFSHGKKIDKFYAYQTMRQYAAESNDRGTFMRTMLEEAWERLERPYYNIWPAILPMLLKVNMDMPSCVLDGLSMQPIELRLPTTQSVPELQSIKSVLLGYGPIRLKNESVKSMVMGTLNTKDDWALIQIPIVPDLTIESLCNEYFTNSEVAATIRLCTCIALINNNPDIITPDILVSDKDKWVSASEEERLRFIERAKERGKNGWDLGAGIEQIPHYRRSHPALVRIGKGRKLTRMVMRKGSVVHRNKLTSIPTGFESEYHEN